MAVKVTDAPDTGGSTLTVLVVAGESQTVHYNGKYLAVCVNGQGHQVLAIERERGVLVDPSAPANERKRDRKKGLEQYWKGTADLADMRDAVLADLIAF